MARKLARKCDTDSDGSIEDGETDGETDVTTAESLLNRRNFVKLSAAATGAVFASSGSSAAAEQRRGIEFDRVVDAVDDLGMDNTGNADITGELDAAYEEGTLIEFPAGEYRVENELAVFGSVDRFGMVGLGETKEDVRFFFPNAPQDDGYWFINIENCVDNLYENFTIDIDDDDKSVSVRADCPDNVLAIDLLWDGWKPAQNQSYGQLFSLNATDVDGVHVARRVTIGPGGGYLGGHESRSGTSPGTSYFRNYENHVGEVRFEDCHFEQCGHNALRSTNNDGVVSVEGGLYRNNDVSNLRFQGGDHPSKRSSIVGATVEVDHSDVTYDTGGMGFWHGAGIMIETRMGNADLLIEDTEIICNDIDIKDQTDHKPNGLVRLTNTGNSNPGGFTMRNTKIYNNTRNQTLWIQSPEDDSKEPNEIVFDNVDVTVDHDTQTEGAICEIDGRDDSSISNSCFYAPNGTFDGVVFENSSNVLVEDSNVNVGGEAVVLTNSDGEVQNVTHDDSCPLPGDDVGGDTTLAVSTDSPTDVGETAVTLDGNLDDLGGADSADCYFEWRETGASEWNVMATQTLSSTGSFSDDLTGLEDGTEYEHRAVADASDGDSDTGSVLTVTTTDDPPAVTTGSASSVTETAATLEGSLDDLGSASSADCYFEYREAGASSWTATAAETLSSAGSFSRQVDGLGSGTEHEYRAVADASDGDSDTGSTASFTTEDGSSGDTAPVIDSYSVSESGSPNPHAEITADWSVSDADGDLDAVLVEAIDESGSVEASARTDVSGTSASGSDDFKIKHAQNEQFDVRLTVTDGAGNSAVRTETVSE